MSYPAVTTNHHRMSSKIVTIAILAILCLAPDLGVIARIKFTNFICNNTDPTFGRFDYCKIVAESRTVHYLTARSELYQLPVENLTIRVQIMQRLNGWKPFLYDVTVGCNFTRRLNKLTRYAWKIVKNTTNVQHDCPYNQSIYEMKRVENRYIEELGKYLPAPPGDFGLVVTFSTYNIQRSYARIHATIY